MNFGKFCTSLKEVCFRIWLPHAKYIHSKHVIFNFQNISSLIFINIFLTAFIERGGWFRSAKQLSLISKAKALLTRIPSCFVNFDGLLCITFLMGSWHTTPPTSEKRSILLDNPAEQARSFSSSIYLNYYILMIKLTFIN